MSIFKFHKKWRLTLITLVGVLAIFIHWLMASALPTIESKSAQTFEAVWQTVNHKFYDPNFNGVNWQAMRSKYAPQVKPNQSTAQLATTINQMLEELHTSHTHFYTSLEPAYYQILGIFAPKSPQLRQQLSSVLPQGKIEYSGIGIFTKDINSKTFIRAILNGSPAEKAGLMVGDRIISVDDNLFEPIQSFQNKAGKTVKLVIERSPNTQQTIEIIPKMLDATKMFVDAMKASVQVIERDNKKIGYVHIWSYASDEYQAQLEEDLIYGRLKNADALILDLREGWGGATPNYLNIYTAQTPTVTSIGRNGRRYTYRYSWNKPVVMLVNEGSRSGKEILAYGFKKYKIGTVVGTKTPGAVVAGSAFLMPDGNLLYLAVADVYVDENNRLEGFGVTPDVVVPFSIEYAHGADPQKQKAIEVALAAAKAAVNK